VIAVAASAVFGVSFALGAFFAGMVVNGSDLSHQAAADALPLQDAFSVLFFVAVGMLFDPMILVRQPLEVLSVVLIVMIGKSIAAFVIVLLFRYSLHTALTISASLAQIGEFSFILAALALSPYLVVEQDRETVEALRRRGIPAFSGDASRPGVLDQANVASARLLAVTAPDPFKARAIISVARRANPTIDTVVRTHSEDERAYLEHLKVGMAVMGERELANTMARYALQSSRSPRLQA
jgi:Kef-type K+ transport system membrane component KefB